MIRSMTAFARCEHQSQWGLLTWELRSVNHRYLEISLRLPEPLRALETTIRERVGQRLSRGKIDGTLRYQPDAQALETITLNHALAKRLIAVALELKPMLQSEKASSLQAIDVLRWPGVVNEPTPDLDPIKATVLSSLDSTLNELIATREREGERIFELIQQRSVGMIDWVQKVRARRPEVTARIRDKLLARLNDIQPETADPGRLEQELAIIAQRLDVDEELDRLDAHLKEIQNVLRRQEPVGRRLDFLMQELNREANTLSSKSADTDTTQAAVEMKVLIEQMREQIQNIE